MCDTLISTHYTINSFGSSAGRVFILFATGGRVRGMPETEKKTKSCSEGLEAFLKVPLHAAKNQHVCIDKILPNC